MSGQTAMIRVGIGGWSFPPWRGSFYPKGLTQARELSYASRQLTSIEINGTFYRTQTPDSFRRWAQETPDDFVFALKAPRYATNRPHLAEAEASIERFFASGVAELGSKLGPGAVATAGHQVVRRRRSGGLPGAAAEGHRRMPVRHALEVRHDSFRTPAPAGPAAAVRRRRRLHQLAEVPQHRRRDGGFRLRPPAARRGHRALRLRPGRPRRLGQRGCAPGPAAATPADLPRLEAAEAGEAQPRPCFVYMIDGAKERAPAAAMALIERLGCVG